MAVFREFEMEWKGETYSVVPSNRLLRRIEGQGVSILGVATRTSTGNPPMSEISLIAAELLRSAGASVTEDEIYEGLMEADASESVAFINDLISHLLPEPKTSKKSQPEETASKPRAKKSRKSTGT